MLDADKYIDRLREIAKKRHQDFWSSDAFTKSDLQSKYKIISEELYNIRNRLDDLIKDYDADFDKALEHYGSGLSSTMRRNEIKTSS